MNPTEPSSLSRRDLLRQGGLVLTLGAIVAACGSDESSDAPGRIGVVVIPPDEQADRTVDDAVFLRTLQSLEYSTIDVYTRLLDLDAFGDNADIAERFIEDHTRQAEEIGGLVSQAGGTPYECANPFIQDRAVEPVIAAVETSDDPQRDGLNSAYAFEEWLGRSYQAIVARLVDGALRTPAMAIGGENQRRAALVALEINPDQIASPSLTGEEATETTEFPPVYAIASTFGQLTAVDLVVGAPSEDDGARLDVQLQTPAENTFVYNDMSC
jgi:hypothetical protein